MLQIFGMISLKIGYRLLNYIINLWALILVLSFAWVPSSSFQSHFVVVIVSLAHSYLEFVCVGCYFYRSSCVGVV